MQKPTKEEHAEHAPVVLLGRGLYHKWESAELLLKKRGSLPATGVLQPAPLAHLKNGNMLSHQDMGDQSGATQGSGYQTGAGQANRV